MSFRTSTTLPDNSSQRRAFPRSQRVTRGTEIEQVRKEGKRVRTASLDARVVASLRALARVGVVVPRYGHSAVDRNRLKRRLKELIRIELLPAIGAVDVVLRTVPRAYDRDFETLRVEIRKLGDQLRRDLPNHEPPLPPTA